MQIIPTNITNLKKLDLKMYLESNGDAEKLFEVLLSPTKDAATQRVLSIYQQIQECLGLNLRPKLCN